MSKNNDAKIGKILEYILSVRPDEFLLVPDSNGYYNFKEVLKAISEKKELSWITKGKIISFLKLQQDPEIEINDQNLIKSLDKKPPEPFKIKTNIPGELYTCIRKKAWPHVMEKGLIYNDKKIILFSSKDLAILKGKRIDQDPVLLFISTKIALTKDINLEGFMENIFLADFIDPEAIKGPSVDKTVQKIKRKPLTEKKEISPAGSFSVNPEDIFPEYRLQQNKGSWQKNKKKLRKQKSRLWPDQNN